jgi:two-component system, chemotaxis family, CheB/CheR fusion protein
MSAERARTVLVADDNDEVRATISQALRAYGFEVIEAANGFETLLQVMRARPDLVVLDLLMPRLGGLEALKQIRESAPETVVVVVTGADDPSLVAQALALGATAVLAKPVDLAELRAVLSEVPAPRPKTPPAARSGQAEPDAGTGAAGRVLIVDDDPEVREVLEEFLAEHGYATRSAGDAPGAFWALMQEMPDVVLLDIGLPGLSGVEIIPTIRFAGRDVKIIMVSGITDVELAKRALAYGAFDYVTKPVDMEYLLRSLEMALSMKGLRPE